MKKTLVLGAGLVAKPLIHYLADAADVALTVVDLDENRARAAVAGCESASARGLDIRDDAALDGIVMKHDVVVSLLPADEHARVARACLKHGRHMTTASYISTEMRALDAPAREAGLTLLNECGLDPGLDHMSALRRVEEIRSAGGKVVSFRSYCGGLPAPEANTNPIGYKFSWAPRGVLSAANAPARYMDGGRVVEVASEQVFAQPEAVVLPGLGEFEGYPNRDSLPYVDVYRLHYIETMFRGTLRNVGHCSSWYDWRALGLFDTTPRDDLDGLTYRDLLEGLVGGSGDLKSRVADFLGTTPDSPSVTKLEWLGLFEDLPVSVQAGANIDVMANRMAEKCPYGEDERDMILMRHEFGARFEHGEKHYSSSLIAFGEPGGKSAMARTVSLPLAVATHMVLRGEIRRFGVIAPVFPEIFNPVLEKLERFGIVFEEREE